MDLSGRVRSKTSGRSGCSSGSRPLAPYAIRTGSPVRISTPPPRSMSSAAKCSGRCITGASRRSASSMASRQVAEPFRTSASCSGWLSSRAAVWSIRLTAVSEPAPIIRIRVDTSSCSLSRLPAASRVAISSLVMSSPGVSRLVATRCAIAANRSSRTALARSGVAPVSRTPSTTRRTSGRCSSGTPKRSQISVVGSG